MRARERNRGFSLIEMMVALTVSLVVIAGALALMSSQQRSFQSTSKDRELQETARIALGHLQNNLRQAGFGVDPGLAFDLGPMTTVRMDRAPSNAMFSSASAALGDGTACAGLCRDRTDGPDEIVFYARDPLFGPHPLTVAATAASTSLTFALLPGQQAVDIQRGQLLQLVCYSDTMTWAYVTAQGAATANGDGTATVAISSSGSSNFPNQSLSLAAGCFSKVATMVGGTATAASLDSAAEVFKVDRFHYFIQSYDAAGNVQAWGTANTRPWLMFDQGRLDATGKLVVTPLVPDVEDLQFGYVFPADAAVPAVGETPGTALTADDGGINLSPGAGSPVYSDPEGAVTRLSHHPGNIGAVRVHLTVRSANADAADQGPFLDPAGNRPQVAAPAGYRRLVFETTVRVPNLSSRVPYYPSYGSYGTYPAASGSRDFNVGGG